MAELDSNRHLSEEQLVWLYYGEEDSAEIQTHLESCQRCSREFEVLKASMAQVDTLIASNPAPNYESRLWSSLVKQEPRLASRPWWKRILPARRIAWSAAVAGMLLAAFLAGRMSTRVPAGIDTAAAAPEVVRERLLIAALSDHLEQSERILLEIDNRELRNEGQRAENLLAANRLYRQTAVMEGKTSLAATLEDLERVLVEVAHSPDRPTAEQLQALQTRIEDQGLLFKVQTLGVRLRQQDQEPLRRPSGEAKESVKSMKG